MRTECVAEESAHLALDIGGETFRVMPNGALVVGFFV